MELERKIYKKMLDWKNRAGGSTALMIEGARRIGKSTIAERFGKENYKSYILIDFAIASQKIKDNFSDNLNDLDTFFQTLSLEYNVRLYNRDSLIIFDEIQKFPKAREAIKYLVKDGRYDFLETGSLISIKENVEDIIIPSEEEKLKMYPLDFEEFLIAANEEILLEYINDCFEKKIAPDRKFHDKALRLFNEYILVGGMPKSVDTFFSNNKDFYMADVEKRRILELYKDDIKKASRKYRSKVSDLFENIPTFLSKNDKKIVLSALGKGNTFEQYSDSLFWLGDSMICNLCYMCSDPNVGFALHKNDSFVKCYMGDTGLLVSLTFSENDITSSNLYKQIMDGRLSLNKGMFFENVIAQVFTANDRKLYYYTHYSAQKKRNDIEVDFLLSDEVDLKTRVIPIEVKSSKNYTTVSYDKFKAKFGKRISESYVIHPKTFNKTEEGYRIPPYMAHCICK